MSIQIIDFNAALVGSEDATFSCTVERGGKQYRMEWVFPEQSADFFNYVDDCVRTDVDIRNVWGKAIRAMVALAGEGEEHASDTDYVEENCPDFIDAMNDLADAIDKW
ncbi:MAG: hypothetical protein GX071_05440 [Gammaproteobacteria bacterium]|nr:hypothetical protein [Gammaproteobacteria bacterium]